VAVAMAIESSGIGPRLQIPVDFRLEFWFCTWFWLFWGWNVTIEVSLLCQFLNDAFSHIGQFECPPTAKQT
jgi:hypothetical protein